MTDDVGELIARTLENASRAPFYARAWGDSFRGIRSIADLVKLPLLDRASAVANQRALVVGEVPAGFPDDAKVLHVLRSEEEHVQLLLGDDKQDAHAGGTLIVGAQPPVRGELRVPWSDTADTLAAIDACLEKAAPDGRRVTHMRLSASALKTVTVSLLERGRDPRTFGIKRIDSNGARLSAHWRALVGGAWGAEIYDNFGLPELATQATECKACGSLHFSWPPLLYEVLDLATGAPIDEAKGGSGRLVVTTLAPWVKRMPLVRYDTGDVVAIGEACEAAGQPRVTFLGRARRGIIVPEIKVEKDGAVGTAFVLAPVYVQDVLEALPDSERFPHPALASGLVTSKELGAPRFMVESEGLVAGETREGLPVARLRFEVRFDPRWYSSATTNLEAKVRLNLLRLDAQLARLVENQALKLEVAAHAPGALQPSGPDV